METEQTQQKIRTEALLWQTVGKIVEKEKRRIGKHFFIAFDDSLIEKEGLGCCDCFRKRILISSEYLNQLENCKNNKELIDVSADLFDVLIHETAHLWKRDFYETIENKERLNGTETTDEEAVLTHGKLFWKYYNLLYDRYGNFAVEFYFELKKIYLEEEDGNI